MNIALALAAVLIGIRLPSYMRRLGMSTSEQIKFVILIFSILGLAVFGVKVLDLALGLFI